MPVARDTTSAISSAPTCVRSSCGLRALRFAPSRPASAAPRAPAACRTAARRPCRSRPCACSSSICERSLLDLFLDVRACPAPRAFSAFQIFLEVGVFASRAARSRSSIRPRRFCEASSFSFFTASRSILQLDQAAVEAVHRLGLGVDLHLDARRRLVDQVDRLVGQEAVGDVAVRQLGRGDDRRVGDLDAVVHLVASPAGRAGSRWWPRRVGSSTSTFWKRRSSAASFSMYLRYSSSVVAPMQCSSPRASAGLSMLPASIAPSALPAPTMVCSSSMKTMIWPSSLARSFSTRLQPLLELAAVLGAGEQRAPCRATSTRLSLQRLGHFAVDDALRQAFDDRGLADAGLADQHRVVLGAPLQHLDRAADLVVAADHRVELALPGALGQVDRVFLQRLALRLRRPVRHGLPAAHRLDAPSRAPCASRRLS